MKMEKKVKIGFKKIFAIFTLIILLQNYGLILGNIVMAVDNEMFDFTVSGNSDFTQIMKDRENKLQELESKQEVVPEEDNENLETSENTTEEEEKIEQNPEEQPKEELPEDTSDENVEDTTQENVEKIQEQLPEQVISSSITSENSSIYKGYFYANIVSGQKYETSYNYTETVEVQNSEFVDEIYVEEEGDKFVFDTGVELKLGTNTYYKQTLISEEEFKNVLGEDGYIELYSADGEIIGTISSETENIDGIYAFNYDVDISEIIVKIINPIQNGTLNIKHIKSIKSELEYSRKQIELFRNIKTTKKVKAVYKEENIWELESITNLINLEETESRMDLDLNSYEFSTMLENQITFNITLKTNEERYDLFQNPTIEILMPSAIEDVEITSVNLLYKNDLSISNWEVVENDAGKKVIKVSLSGSQTEYTPGSMQEGTTLVIYTKINVNKLTSNTDEKIKMTYTNKNSSKLYYEVAGKEAEEVDIRFVSREGILKSNSLLNFNESLEGIYSFNDEVLVGNLDVEGNKKTATINMAVVNNYSKELNNVSIIGRIPSQGVADGNGNDLGTTIDTLLLGAVTYSGVASKIYYSYKIDASVEDDSWIETITDYGLVKSYKIVLENSMKQGDRAEFGYSILIPENLNYNETLFSTYQVNYYIDNQLITEISSIGAQTEKREIVLEDCKEQVEYENVTIGMNVTKGGIEVQEGEEIFERQILRYTVVLKNTTSKTLNNVKIKGKAANSNLYYYGIFETENYGEIVQYKCPVEDDGKKEYEELIIEQLRPNEEAKLEYQVIVKEVEETAEEYVWGEVYISSDELQETKIETSKNKIKQAKVSLKVELGATETMNDTDLASGYTIKYCVSIKNISKEILKDFDVNVFLPEILDYNPESFLIGEDDLIRYQTKIGDKNKVTFEIPELEIEETKEMYMIMNVKEMDLSILKQQVSIYANTCIDEEEYISNDYIKTAWQRNTDVEYELTSNPLNGSEVKNDDEIEYILKIKNIGEQIAKVNIWNSFPNGLSIEDIILIVNDEKIQLEKDDGFLSLFRELESNKELEIKIKARVNSDLYIENQKYIENQVEIYGSNIKEKNTNVISFKIVDNEENTENEEENLEDFYTPEELEKFEQIQKEEAESEKNSEQQDDKDIDNEKENDSEQEDNNPKEKEEDKVDNEQKEQNDNNKQEENNAKQNDNKENNANSGYIGEQNTIIQDKSKGNYTIKGKVWLDLNKNGKYDLDETKLNNINVRLYKSTNGSSVVYSSNNLINKVKTDSEGNYEFSSLEDGYYLVMVEYDSEKYSLTEYRSKYAGESSNSDFITKTTTIDGNKKTVAISDIIKISSNNISSIDLGLVQNDESDIEIKKSISSITVEDDEGKETIEYNEDKIAKLEIAAKKLGKAKATIIYEFEITNNGDLDTYITNLVDYLPEGLEFNEKTNSGWYKGEDNNLYNLSLINTKIESGKTKKLKLALTQEITDDTLGSYINKTEILETTNDKKISEINLDNNKAEVELLITIKTGKIILYFSIVIIIAIIATVITLFIKKKIIKPVYK